MTLLSKLSGFSRRHPVLRGIGAYAVIWPLSSCIQQTMSGKSLDQLDYGKAFRFSLYGSLFVAPTLYGWFKFSSFILPQTTLKTAMAKALLEQVSYGPAAVASFFFGMSLLEMKTVDEAVQEVKAKFLPTYKVGVCFWPIIQTLNVAFIPERNRVPFVSVVSLIWTSYLAYMKQLERGELQEK